jgi:hypothetical protein
MKVVVLKINDSLPWAAPLFTDILYFVSLGYLNWGQNGTRKRPQILAPHLDFYFLPNYPTFAFFISYSFSEK